MLNVSIPAQEKELCPKIIVIGVGGAGGNAVDNMIESSLEGVDFMVCNTDAQALGKSLCDHKVQLGGALTQGLGAGSQPEVGRAAAEESIDEVIKQLDGMNMAFVTCGMGGGTGTGAAPIIAKAAKEKGLLTVGVVTKPFHFEGAHRMRLAEAGIEEMQEYVDTLIVIPNQNLFRIANEKTTFSEAFKMADSVLQSGVRGVTDLMIKPGLINLDFADVRCAMMEMGKAMMGTGESSGEGRAVKAAEAAINNPLLDDISMKGARGVIINITGGYDMTLYEADEACNRIRDEVDTDANIIFGSTFDDKLEGVMRVSVVATGIEGEALRSAKPLKPAVMNPVSGSQEMSGTGVETKTIPQREVPKAESQGNVRVSETAVMNEPSDMREQDMFDMSPKKTIQPVGAGATSGAAVTGGQQTQYDPSFFGASPTGGISGFSVPSMQSMPSSAGQGAMMSASTPAEYGQTHIDTPQTSGALALNPQQHNDETQTSAEVLRGQRVGEAFIPPQPMKPSDQFVTTNTQAQQRKSAAGSSLVLNPPKAPVQKDENAGQKKSSSLFERFTGAYKSLRNAYIEEDFSFSQESQRQSQGQSHATKPAGQQHSSAMQQPQKNAQPMPQNGAAQYGASSSVFSSLGHDRSAGQSQTPKQQQLNMDLAQPKLKEKQEADKTDLDIPAFLRRQAN